jgi:hypothetical protein
MPIPFIVAAVIAGVVVSLAFGISLARWLGLW